MMVEKMTPQDNEQQKPVSINYFAKTCEGTPTTDAPQYPVGLAFSFGTPRILKNALEKIRTAEHFRNHQLPLLLPAGPG
jgi:hypothetical protein